MQVLRRAGAMLWEFVPEKPTPAEIFGLVAFAILFVGTGVVLKLQAIHSLPVG